jgi:hypothetical protein
MSRPFLTGEATPYYLFHPQVAKRVKRSLPEVKLIILLRDPVDRAYSHYNHEVAMGVEKLSFEKALQAESARLDGEHERLLQESHYKSFNHQHFSYLARGLYAEQLTIWREEFSQEQVHVICSEDFFRDAARSMGDVWRFLDLPKHSISDFETHNLGRYLPMKQETRDELNDYFNSHNQKLFNLLGRDYGWGLR